ncbi:MAG: hypothetical protein AAFR61_16425 [Bacteroidota bacterium]
MSTKEIIQHIFSLPKKQQWEVVKEVLEQLQAETSETNLAGSGEAMSMEAFKERIKKAESDLDLLSTEEVRQRLASWK